PMRALTQREKEIDRSRGGAGTVRNGAAVAKAFPEMSPFRNVVRGRAGGSRRRPQVSAWQSRDCQSHSVTMRSLKRRHSTLTAWIIEEDIHDDSARRMGKARRQRNTDAARGHVRKKFRHRTSAGCHALAQMRSLNSQVSIDTLPKSKGRKWRTKCFAK